MTALRDFAEVPIFLNIHPVHCPNKENPPNSHEGNLGGIFDRILVTGKHWAVEVLFGGTYDIHGASYSPLRCYTVGRP